ncbi:MAG TPA: hypothetical protein VIH54_04095, partial [Chthoniobacterales bacterium]
TAASSTNPRSSLIPFLGDLELRALDSYLKRCLAYLDKRRTVCCLDCRNHCSDCGRKLDPATELRVDTVDDAGATVFYS